MATDPISGDEGLISDALPVPVEAAVPAGSKPRVWTVFVAYLAVLAAIIGAQVVLVIVVFAWYTARGWSVQRVQQELPALLSTPLNFIMIGAITQLLIGLGALVPAWFSRQRFRDRLGLTRPVLRGWGYPVVVLGTLLPFAVGMGLAILLSRVHAPNPLVGELYKKMTWSIAVPFILFIAIAPGLTEELFFRGYVQRRLLQRWPAWLAIPVCSLLFAIMHLDPHHVVFAFPIGLWLGVVAWRTDSIWPSVLCHAFINGGWNTFQILGMLYGWPQDLPLIVVGASGIVGLGCAVGSFWIMGRKRKAD